MARMAGSCWTPREPPSKRMAALIHKTSTVFAVAAGVIASAAALLTTLSILGRWFWSAPIPGDVELTQFGIAISISMCLPWCQLQRGNIIVDFFTSRSSSRTVRVLDAIGAVALAAMMGVLAWQTAVGAAASRAVGETTMILGLPMWLVYAVLAPGLAMTMLIALLQAAGVIADQDEAACEPLLGVAP